MKMLLKAFVVASLATLKIPSAEAIIACQDPHPLFENSNFIGNVTLHGSEANDWMEDQDGYSICDLEDERRLRALHKHHHRRHHKHIRAGVLKGMKTQELRSSDYEYQFYYCQLIDDEMVPNLDWPVLITDPNLIDEIQPHMHPLHAGSQQCGLYCTVNQSRRRSRKLSQELTSGTVQNLVILFRFSDHATKSLPSVSDYEIVMNSMEPVEDIAPMAGVKKVFHDNSGGILNLESTVVDWVTLDAQYTEEYCSGGNKGFTYHFTECLVNALSKVDTAIDFSQFDVNIDQSIDGIAFIHSGLGAEWSTPLNIKSIWSHKFCLNDGTQCTPWTSAEGISVSDYHVSSGIWSRDHSLPTRVACLAHETTHFLGLKDLYDTDGGGTGIGQYSLMAYSWGWDDTGNYPPLMDPWSRIKLGWATADTLDEDATDIVLLPSYDSAHYYKIERGFPEGEYLLIENRQAQGYDVLLPQNGILIWHIDEAKTDNTDEGHPGQNGWPENNNHYMVSLIQADGGFDLEKGWDNGDTTDVFHEGGTTRIAPGNGFPNTNSYQNGNLMETGVTISNIRSDGNTMVFDLSFSDPTNSSTDPTGPTRPPRPNGGGADNNDPSTDTSTRPTRPPRCVDDPDFERNGVLANDEEMDCDAYRKYSNLCLDYGHWIDTSSGLSAIDACCACKE